MGNPRRGSSTWDAVLGFIMLGAAMLLLVALLFFDTRQVPGWVPLIALSSAAEGVPGNPCGVAGAISAGYLYFLFGAAAYLWVIVLAGYGLAKLMLPRFSLAERAGWAFLMVLCGASLLAFQPWFFRERLPEFNHGPGGFFGIWVGKKAFQGVLGPVGAPVVLSLLYVSSLILAIGFHPVVVAREMWQKARERLGDVRQRRLEAMDEARRLEVERAELERKASKLEKKLRRREKEPEGEPPRAAEPAAEHGEPKIIDATAPPEKRPTLAEIEAMRRKNREESLTALSAVRLENYQLPPLDLLDPLDHTSRGPADHEELLATQQTILDTLAEFGIEATAGDITFGPTITRYEVKPVRGVRVDRIASLERDIARATRAARIHILAPIPGKDTVGIEIANPRKVKVTLRELLETGQWLESPARLPLALGKDVYGKPIIADLAKMPHCLIGGTTGSGKSVCVNALIASLLFRFSPAELRFIMIDPKVVEMQVYNRLPHMATPVVTDPKKVLLALRWVVDEMELRYKIFAKVGVRNIHSFNERQRAASARATPAEETEGEVEAAEREPSSDAVSAEAEEPLRAESASSQEEIPIPERMPYIVVIIDELADLMQTTPADVEAAIARITQMARAAGIHVIVATQTPRADVITGVIKANIPTRIAFQVASALDSRVILDQKGAEKLLGQGDMMYLPPGSSELIRAQGVLVTDEEIHRLVDFVASQAAPSFEPAIHEKLQNAGGAEEEVTEEDEELVQKFIEIMKQERRASTSLFQRRLRLGYSRAARIVDIMEKRGILGPVNGAKDREILVDLDSI